MSDFSPIEEKIVAVPKLPDFVENALIRLTADIQVARRNWYRNPSLAVAALCDLHMGSGAVSDALALDGEANRIAESQGLPDADDILLELKTIYKSCGVNLSQFEPPTVDMVE